MSNKQPQKPRMKTWKIVFLSYFILFVIWQAISLRFSPEPDDVALTPGELAGIAIDLVIEDLGTDTDQLWFFLNPTRLLGEGEHTLVYRISGSVSRGRPPAFRPLHENFGYHVDDQGYVYRYGSTKEEDVPNYLSN